MNRSSRVVLALTLAIAIGGTGTGLAQVSDDQLARLRSDLAPVGAERAGNVNGTIPPWTGGLAKAPPIDPAVLYVDPFTADVTLFTITAKSV